MDIEEMLKMPLNTQKKIPGNIWVVRVPGGWVYESVLHQTSRWDGFVQPIAVSSTFVPEPKEE